MLFRKHIVVWPVVLIIFACVDRLPYNLKNNPAFIVVVDGSISDQPGPYTIRLTRAFDIEAKLSPRVELSARRVVLSDNAGNLEEVNEVEQGIYQTSPTGIRGKVGNAYKLRIELFDGRVYESLPDTLYAPGKVEKIMHEFREKIVDGKRTYSFEIKANSTSGETANYRQLLKFVGTFQSKTNPELKCEPIDQALTNCEPCANAPDCYGCNRCNLKPLCSGIRNWRLKPLYPPTGVPSDWSVRMLYVLV